MTVSELIAELKFMPEDAEIQVAYESSDYWRTRICNKIVDVEDNVVIEKSDYHRCDKISQEEYQEMDQEDLDQEVHRKIVIINL